MWEAQLKSKWKLFVLGAECSPEALQRIKGDQGTMLTSKGQLWPDVPNAEDASDIFISMRRLREMALGLCSPASPLYMDSALSQQLINGLEWLHRHRYNEAIKPQGNWWFWEIGVPIALLETIIITEDLLDRELIERLLLPVDKYVAAPAFHAQCFVSNPPVSTGANLVWKVTAAALSAVIQGNEQKLLEARNALKHVLHYSEAGDGFYQDGSFIQHDKYAYTGGYGVSLLHDIVRLLVWLHDTPWALRAEEVALTHRWIMDSFLPVMYRGLLLDMVSGREISRRDTQNHESGHSVITSCLRLSRILDAPSAAKLLSKVKQLIIADTYKPYVACSAPDTAEQARRLLENDLIKPAREETLCKLFARMDRAVLQGPGFAFGISMFSKRMYSYESINGENLKGWYSSYGMTSLYNNDLGQYADGYWPTVNPYRLPGTTVAVKPREDGAGSGRLSSRAFVGGAAVQMKYGAIAMELEDVIDVREERLTCRKSWFLMGDYIALLGSDITASGNACIETIIENRKLNDEGQLVLLADGRQICGILGQVESLQPRWLHLSGGTPETELGIVIPKRQTLHALYEARQAAWSDINRSGATTDITRSYATLWFDHGITPIAAEYAYILLPGRKEEETAQFAEHCPLRIVEQSAHAHAVEDRERGVFAAHFWQSAPYTAGPVSCSGQASIILKQDGGNWSLAVADPTQEQLEPIELELRLPNSDVLPQSERIRVLSRECDSVKLIFDPAHAAGASFDCLFSSALK